MSNIGTCCRNSAKMLEIADPERPDLQKHNRGQAELLRRAADMADEQTALVAELLAAVTGLVEAYHDSIHGVATFSQATKLAAAMDAARAAIAKAEGVS